MDKIIDRLQKDRLKHAQNLKKRVEEVEQAAFKVSGYGTLFVNDDIIGPSPSSSSSSFTFSSFSPIPVSSVMSYFTYA